MIRFLTSLAFLVALAGCPCGEVHDDDEDGPAGTNDGPPATEPDESNFFDTRSWAAYDPGTDGVGEDPDGYAGAIFDGRFLYFPPARNGAGPHGEFLRYDTDGGFDAESSWAAFDPGAAGVGTAPAGYFGGTFDGEYVYFVPNHNGERHGEVLRLDTTGSFTNTDSWQAFDPGEAGVGEDPDGYLGAAFDGRYVYFAPFDNGERSHGEVLRFDTDGAFADPAAWATFEAAAHGVGVDPVGFTGAVYDERYVYFVPFQNEGELVGEVLRYDTTADFSSPEAWTTFDTGAVASHAGYHGGVFDGRYLYLVPWGLTEGQHGEVVRFDTTQDFESVASWVAYEAGTDGVGVDPQGYKGATFDGRFVYFAPWDNGSGPHGEILRFDTDGAFDDDASWQTYDPGSEGVGDISVGFYGIGNDGDYIYFVPNNAGDDQHGEVLRFFTGDPGVVPASIEGGSTF